MVAIPRNNKFTHLSLRGLAPGNLLLSLRAVPMHGKEIIITNFWLLVICCP